MSPEKDFRLASRCDFASTLVFGSVTLCSAILLLFPATNLETLIQPILIVLCILGVVLSRVVRSCQTEGNRKLRDSQLRDAFDIPLGESARAGYYNSPTPPSLDRLAVTTLENTRFTIAIIEATIVRTRLFTSIYVLIFILLMAFRQTDLNWLLFLCQTLFSAEVVLKWFSFERFFYRTQQARQQLRQHFIEVKRRKNGRLMTPIILSTFTEYECAKDEAAQPLDSKVYRKINAKESKNWEQEMVELGISSTGKKASP